MLHTAHGLSAELVGRLKLSPDIDNMSDASFQEFVQAINVAQSIKDELLKVQKNQRRNLYNEKIEWVDLNNAENAQRDLNNYLIKQRIMMSDELSDAVREVSKELALVNSGYRNYKQYNLGDSLSESAERFSKTASQMEHIGSLIQKRLNYEKA